MKRLIIVLGLIGILTGCSFRPRSFEDVSHAQPQTVASLVGQTRADIHAHFGTPILSRTEKNRTLWSYQASSCALLVYFDETGICRHAETRGKCQ